MHSLFLAAVGLILVRLGAQLWLDHLNRRHVAAHALAVPEAFREFMDEPTYRRSVEYTLAKSRHHRVELVWEALVLVAVLGSGVLPAWLGWIEQRWGHSAWAMAGGLFAVGVGLAALDLPLAWHAQFRLEQRFGFNTTTRRLWILDRLKALLLAGAIGCPLLALILKLVDWLGSGWWFWAWVCLLVFQLVMTVAAPVLILPLFNKLTPLPGGPLRERLLALGARTGFHAGNILVMDGSKRSRHSNAFFTSFGRFRKIVLFDTLMQQLEERELEAVLAHEIGHYKLRHIPKMLAASAVAMLAGFWGVAWLARQPWFDQGFGFAAGDTAAALLLFALLSGLVSFWWSPLANWWSRRYEYQADAFAAGAMNEARPLVTALRKLNEKNLGNLTPHPVYSGFYYSHPTLLEREQALNTFQKTNIEHPTSTIER